MSIPVKRTVTAATRLIAGVAAALLAWSAAAADTSPIRSIDVTKDSDAYVADIVMFAPVPAAIAWAVLTDFDHMANWVPNVRESKILSSDGDVLTIEQQGVAKFGLAQFPYTSVRQMTLEPQNSVRAKQIKGSMKRLESLMNLSSEGSGTRLKYHLEVVPSGLAAAVMSKEFLQHEMTEQFTAIIQEMVRRSR
ncbi:MAG TPA: SRPBCC family protein [Casimicrobiaceae bacterium]|nr:SRPBCC family protein [Casimicrobiaceae bacterium]